MVKQYLADACNFLGHTGADLGAGLETRGGTRKVKQPLGKRELQEHLEEPEVWDSPAE